MGEAARRLVAEFADGVTQPRPLRAIQDEALERSARGRITNEDEVRTFVESIPDEYIPCRESGRHYYPIVKPQDMRFQPTPDGLDRWEADCTQCGMAYKWEVWLIREKRDGRVSVMQLVDKGMDYRRPEDGEAPYLAPPGTGYVAPTAIHETRVASAFVGQKVKRVGRQQPATD